MGLFDGFDFMLDVVCPAFETITESIESAGRSVDRAVVRSIDVVGGAADSLVDTVKDNPGKTAAIAAAIAATGGIAIAPTIGATGLAGLTTTTVASGISAAELAVLGPVSVVAQGLVRSVIDNFVRGTACPVEGSIVYCDLGLGGISLEHSGVYVGNGQIVHLDGSGAIGIVSHKEFLARLGGLNCARDIYVSCDGSNAVGTTGIAERARSMVGTQRNYSFVIDNCHQFSSGCITGNFENSDNFLWSLKHTAEQYLAVNTWRVWETN